MNTVSLARRSWQMLASQERIFRHVRVSALVVVTIMAPRGAPAAECMSDTIGVDPSSWTSARGTFLGRAVGQTFFAQDTLISRITVWRPPHAVDPVGAHVFVTGVDTSATPPRPDTGTILLDGPTVIVRDSDPPGQLIEVPFNLGPLALPHPGLYAFFIQSEDCDPGETLIAANDDNPYSQGHYWITGRTAGLPCFLRAVDGGQENTDLVFRMEFCRIATTPVRQMPWGRLKLIYR